MICLFHFPSLQPCVDTTFFASMQSFIHTTFEVASMHLHRRKVASMRLFQNCTGHSTLSVCAEELLLDIVCTLTLTITMHDGAVM